MHCCRGDCNDCRTSPYWNYSQWENRSLEACSTCRTCASYIEIWLREIACERYFGLSFVHVRTFHVIEIEIFIHQIDSKTSQTQPCTIQITRKLKTDYKIKSRSTKTLIIKRPSSFKCFDIISSFG